MRVAVLEYLESRRELDTWQERLGHERGSHRASGGKLTVGSAKYFTLQVRYAFVYGHTVTHGLVLLRRTCPRLGNVQLNMRCVTW